MTQAAVKRPRGPAPASDGPVILWLRRELRVHDNPALAAAVASGHRIIPVYVLDQETPGAWAPGGAALWWLHHSLTSLGAEFARLGAPLVLRRGRFDRVLPALVAETGAREIHAGQPVEPWARTLVEALAPLLGVPLHLHRTITLFEPDSIRTKTGGPYGVFTPFANACRARGRPAAPLPPPRTLAGVSRVVSDDLERWKLVPRHPDWAGGFRETWRPGLGGAPGEAGAAERLHHFTKTVLGGYADSRNLPGMDGVSMLSPRLHWGELSAATAWHAAEAADSGPGAAAWIAELLWREFSMHLLWHHPTLPEQPLRPEFAGMPWRDDGAGLAAWQRGRTGLPIVDAGMRQLWHVGWMHNRVRMIVASFLVKHLLLPWQAGAAWFWDTLVDADLASNSAQWQWVAGCGADAAPFFRVFNPVLQGQKFDPDGSYVRSWVPELASVPDRFVHAPWQAAEPPAGYPRPVVDLARGRDRALAAFHGLRARA